MELLSKWAVEIQKWKKNKVKAWESIVYKQQKPIQNVIIHKEENVWIVLETLLKRKMKNNPMLLLSKRTNQDVIMVQEVDVLIALMLISKTNKLIWNGYANMDQMQNVPIA